MGHGLALARRRLTKHAVKQVDRLLFNRGIDVDALSVHWVSHAVGQRDSITVAMDWTEFDADGQASIMLSLLSRHGRVTPLVWLTVDKAALKNLRNDCQDRGGTHGRDAVVRAERDEVLLDGAAHGPQTKNAPPSTQKVPDRPIGQIDRAKLRNSNSHSLNSQPCDRQRNVAHS